MPPVLGLKGVGRIYQQTFVDTYSKVAFAKLYDRKTPITAADLLNVSAVLTPSSNSLLRLSFTTPFPS